MGEAGTPLMCKACGKAFYAFLYAMAKPNSKVVCPRCGAACDYPTNAQLEERAIREAALDETIQESFPASDPPSSDPNAYSQDAA